MTGEVDNHISLEHLMDEASAEKLRKLSDDPFVQMAIERMEEDEVDAVDVLVDLVCDLMLDVKRANEQIKQLARGGNAS